MLRFVLAHITRNMILNLYLWRLYNALWSELVLPSASTLRNICWTEYLMTVDAIKKQLPSRNKVSLALVWWTSTNKLAIISVIFYYMDQNWALRHVQVAFDVVDSPCCSNFESSLRITGHRSTYGRTASLTLEGSSRSFWAGWQHYTWNNNR